MKRNTLILVVSIGLILITALVGILFFASQNASPKQPAEGRGFFGSLFPFNFGNDSPEIQVQENKNDLDKNTSSVPRLRKISNDPVVSSYFFKDGSVVGVRYIERATGNVYDSMVDTLTLKRVSNTTIPDIQEALWFSENEFVIRYLNTDNDGVETFYVKLSSTTEEQSLSGKFIPSWNKADVDKEEGVIFSSSEQGGATLSSMYPDGSAQKTVLNSPIQSWIPHASNGLFFVSSSPASNVSGGLYQIASSGSLIPVVRNRLGLLVKLSPSAQYAFGSEGGDEISSFLVDTTTRVEYAVPVSTLANKCTFVSESPVLLLCGVPKSLPKANYPNDWLLGRVPLSDDVWLVNPTAGTATFVASLEDLSKESLDVFLPAVSEGGEYFSFINKNDLSLWTLRVNESEPSTLP